MHGAFCTHYSICFHTECIIFSHIIELRCFHIFILWLLFLKQTRHSCIFGNKCYQYYKKFSKFCRYGYERKSRKISNNLIFLCNLNTLQKITHSDDFLTILLFCVFALLLQVFILVIVWKVLLCV